MNVKGNRCCLASSMRSKINVKGDDCCIMELDRMWIEPSEEDVNKTKELAESKPSKGKTSSSPVSQFQVEFCEGDPRGVKVFKTDPGADMAFVKEVRVLHEIGTHPHIVEILGFSKPRGGDGYKYWMEKMKEDLHKTLKVLSGNSQPFSVTDAKNILLQIAKAMKHLHESEVIHGDLKSANILVSRDKGSYTVKVADFGNAIIMKPSDKEVYISGTEGYAAPEVWEGLSKEVSGAPEAWERLRKDVSGTPVPRSIAKNCDVYSFGIVAVEVLEVLVGRKVKKGFKDILKRSEGIKERVKAIEERVEAIRK